MTPWTRGVAPVLLGELGPGRAIQYVEQRQADGSARFTWPQKNKVSLLAVVREALEAMTVGHCSYCDGFPIDAQGKKEIDHFKPKADFPHDVCTWSNLFLACTACNDAKLKEWSADLRNRCTDRCLIAG